MYDGDLTLVVDDEVMMSGVDRNAKIVIDVEDKVTALKEEYNIQNRTNCIIRSLRSSIGEISNYASAYHNKNLRQMSKRSDMRDLWTCFLLSTVEFAVVKPCERLTSGVAFNGG